MNHIISLGAGVQSTAMLLMAMHGEIEPLPIAAIFADTGWEPPAVYAHLEWLERTVGEKIPIVRVSAGNIRADAIAAAEGHGGRFATLPFFVQSGDGGRGMLRRQCTHEYKVRPIRAKIREISQGEPVTLWLGISLDEVTRMRLSDVTYIANRYPLIEARMSRWNCLRWLAEHGYPEPPRSACVGCPFRSDAEWRMIRAEPSTWADAIEFDRAMRHLPRIDGEAYLHSSLRPLEEVDLRTAEDHGQMSLWDAECGGMCGI